MTSSVSATDAWAEVWLSAPRFGVYVATAGGDRRGALTLYEWNTQLSSALLHDLAHLEVGIRNAYDQAFTQHGRFAPHWTACSRQVFAPLPRTRREYDAVLGRKVPRQVDVNRKPRSDLERAVTDAGGPRAPAGKVVAQLMFGFWRYLSSSAHEVSLWRPYLHHAFPPGTSRAFVDSRMSELHRLRNRVAHHEPLLTWDVAGQHRKLVELATLIVPQLGRHISMSSKVPVLLAARP